MSKELEIQKELHKGMIALIEEQNKRIDGIIDAINFTNRVIEHTDRLVQLNKVTIEETLKIMGKLEEKLDTNQ